MSRVGLLPITVPSSVKVNIDAKNITVEGPKGKLSRELSPGLSVELKDGRLVVNRANEEKQTKAFHGLNRALLNNMVIGVSEGFTKTLVINGVGYRSEVKGNILALNLGYSMQIEYAIPEGVEIKVEGQTKIMVSGISKELVGQVSSEIRGLRAPEPYKGKGVKYADENIRRKVGKSGGKGKK
ncbi:MAG: 50S ribosomal protein L6 [Spirochaetales bacterium]|nr:50S ribosomal protein L6 [Spirochaetales bacterium]